MNITIKDVAKLAGVSPSTVSRTCRDHPSISEETKIKVRNAMNQLGYEPSAAATAVANHKTRTIGVVFPASEKEAYENSFYLEAIRGISRFANQKNYTVSIITGSTESELMKSIHHAKVDGFIFLYSNLDDHIINYMYEEGHLFVLIGKATKQANDTIYVDNDNVQAGKEVCEYLIGLGHQRISYIGTESRKVFSSDRKAGYLLALSEHDIPYQENYCLEFDKLPNDEEPNIQDLLKQSDHPTAFIVCDDMIAMALLRNIRHANLSVPQDISVIGFNNSIISRLTSPTLTSIDINSHQLGIEAASQIINHIERPDLFATKIIVPYFLVERDSCAAIKTAE